ncbi:LuxR C-terminal-related transcriptional regulator [Candidatus Fukatsuia endosymbiont of Tuberolachnus salignus]|uniref:LuxR C-terminal-related transcriptional regulator n=1 Tax=Candidatus Fukatsuia endosymbiont of Tuberolachnus salignus TaxID=3077957 RepID=UPI00313D21E5
MDDDINHAKIPDSQRITVDSLELFSFKSFMEIGGQPWGVRDNESRYVYANEAALDVFDLPVNFDIEGRLDNECPAPWSEFAGDFQRWDREAEKGKSVGIISTQVYTRKKVLQPYFAEKFPLYKETVVGNEIKKECIGTAFYGRKLNFCSLPQYVSKLTPSILVLDPPTDIFTKRELDVVFYLHQSLPSKMIARALDVSHDTIEKYKTNIFQKAGVCSVGQFKEFCEATGFDRYIPKRFMQPGVQFI